MRIRTLQSVALAALFSLVGGNSIAEAPINARSYQCQELKQLVADKGRVVISAWRTKDVFSCVVGYRCLPRIDLENRLGFGSD